LKITKILAIVCIAALTFALFGACAKEKGGDSVTPWKTGDPYPIVTITIGDNGAFKGGVVTAELYPDKAPNTVHNFISLINSGYYVGKVFHRAVPGFMIQGGSPGGDGMSVGFPYSIDGEFTKNGFAQNNLKHITGVLSMARTNDPNSASTQFFIMHGDSSSLDGQYAAFGKVLTGQDVVDRVAQMPATNEQLVTKPVITAISVDTFGIEYPEPVTNAQ